MLDFSRHWFWPKPLWKVSNVITLLIQTWWGKWRVVQFSISRLVNECKTDTVLNFCFEQEVLTLSAKMIVRHGFDRTSEEKKWKKYFIRLWMKLHNVWDFNLKNLTSYQILNQLFHKRSKFEQKTWQCVYIWNSLFMSSANVFWKLFGFESKLYSLSAFELK